MAEGLRCCGNFAGKILAGVLGTALFLLHLPGNVSREEARTGEIQRHIHFLSRISPARTWDNPDSLKRVAAYIYGRLKDHGLPARYQVYRAGGYRYRNVIGSAGNSDRPLVVVGAHYDVCTPQPGADDNASGVAALLELSRLVGKSPGPLGAFELQLVFYPLEEPPFFGTASMGSAVHARYLKRKGREVRFMLSVDMIGYFSPAPSPPPRVRKILGSRKLEKGNATALLGLHRDRGLLEQGARLIHRGSAVQVLPMAVSRNFPGGDWSDHRNYWALGIPAIFLTNYFVCPNPGYHSPEDTMESVDCRRIASLTDGILRFLGGHRVNDRGSGDG